MSALVLIISCTSATYEYQFDDVDTERTPSREANIRNGIAELDAYIVRQISRRVTPGAAVSIVYDDEVLYQKAYNQSVHRPYAVLSFTKTFTALAVLQLAEAGKLRLEDRADQLLGATLEADRYRDRPITVRHLLTHTSGIPDSGPLKKLNLYPAPYIPEQNHPAGDRFQYSNPGYRLLGMIVEKRSGQSIQSYITENLVRPLEMSNTRFSVRSNGASGMVSSVADLANYVELYINRGRFRDRQIISEKHFYELFTTPTKKASCPYAEHRGIAWRVQTYEDRVLLMNHAALGLGVGGMIQIYPEHKIGFVFLSNPPTYNDHRYLSFYKELRDRLNGFAANVGEMDFRAGTGTPCALHTVPW
ncbi:MAG: beta-lactamase family protein [bacterium]|nr:beta-lactamase family protein [bacterium]